jgi:hypothetical protein
VTCDNTSVPDRKQVKAMRLELFLMQFLARFKEGLVER